MLALKSRGHPWISRLHIPVNCFKSVESTISLFTTGHFCAKHLVAEVDIANLDQPPVLVGFVVKEPVSAITPLVYRMQYLVDGVSHDSRIVLDVAHTYDHCKVYVRSNHTYPVAFAD